MKKPTIAIVGAGAGGLMAADFLSTYQVDVQVYEQMPSAGRKILWAGKTGLNLSHSEPMATFVQRYTPADWLAPFLYQYSNKWLVDWLDELGIETYVGSSGRIFPVAMKGSPLLRAWLKRLTERSVKFFYRHSCIKINQNTLTFTIVDKDGRSTTQQKSFDAIILACGGGSYQRLGSDGRWQAWFDSQELSPLYASNVGIVRTWSPYMEAYFGRALKRVAIWVDNPNHKSQGDVVISHYGLESGLIYKHNLAMRQRLSKHAQIELYVDLLPDKSLAQIAQYFNKNRKLSLQNLLRKVGLDEAKIAFLRECTPKSDWQSLGIMAKHIKCLCVIFYDFRPMDEAISTGGGVKRQSLNEGLQLLSNPYVFCCGEMLDFDAPTGGYLLTACFATGRVAAMGAWRFLTNNQ